MPVQPPIGIDLGTTYSAVATINGDGLVDLVPNGLGKSLTPSAVYFEGPSNFVVGENAKEARINAPDLVVEFIKRQMGRDFTYEAHGSSFTPIEISAIILKNLKEDAEASLGIPIQDVVVTCPAYFTAEQRDATEKAANMVGLKVLSLINEPTAAAVAFGMGGDKSGNALVFDLGGGTFDVTILAFEPGNVISVKVSDGDSELGGKDFDDRIMTLAVDYFMQETGFDLREDESSYAELRDKAEKAKRQISQMQKTTINLIGGGQRAKFELTREAFNDSIAGLLDIMRDKVETALQEAKLTPDQIDDVVLVGGSTYSPAVRDMVQEFFGRPPNTTINPDEAVAKGAALMAAKFMVEGTGGADSKPLVSLHDMSVGVQRRLKDLPTVIDVINHSIGVEALDETGNLVHSIILKRGTALPAVNEENFTTASENQRGISTDVYEGEELTLEDVNKLTVEPIHYAFDSPKPKGYPIKIAIKLDHSGILRVTINDFKAARTHKADIPYTSNMSTQDVVEKGRLLRSSTTSS